ncbi:MAG: DNA mismatch repair endonuclease MutL [Bacteroidia bacterium]|nr:DNA mismatch repair endonuclease MutL [Bacteroidia bacterium]MCF8426332.1 DNA mismatch repair endonuclease MutL [Bacteroidia bacterium]MCF8445769.1 DNA mismatch repair endonuclease MutL [Bacteroidia bacterium]
MSDIIKLLPDHVASQIAAGEVIQRPSSVVKELLDNAIDAASTEIILYVKDAGKGLIQVIDNGIGMSAMDARMCWERHATSKIRMTEDIFSINTMGFRGEALASIASVAQVEMKSRRDEDELGTHILIEGSEVKKQEPTATPIGTSISVKNLFYNIPARRNFLKSNPVEWKHLVEEFNRAALSNPEIRFSLYHNEELELDYVGETLMDRVLSVFSDKKEGDLIELDEQTSIINVKGFIGKPELAKRLRGEQYFFVNKRFFKDNYLNHAVNNAFEGTISKEQFPLYVIQISIDPSQIDINVHPTKTEVKFEDDRNVYQILRAVVRKALGTHIQAPQNTDFDDNRFINLQLNPPSIDEVKPYSNSGATVGKNDWGSFKDLYQQQRKESAQNWQTLFQAPNPQLQSVQPELVLPKNDEIQDTRVFFQLNNQYIVTPIKSGLMLVNQQAAHERILFEKYLLALDQNHIASQQLLFPKVINLLPGDEVIMEEILPEMGALGFTINAFGKNAFVINGLPAELHLENEQELLSEILETYKSNKQNEMNKHKNVAKTLAKKAAIKAGLRLKPEEMNRLVDELFACSDPQFSPDGKPCVSKLTLQDISKMF